MTSLLDDPLHRAAVDQIVEHGRRLNSDGLAVGPAGNLSIRLGDLVAITPSQIRYDEIVPEDVCFTTLDGEKVAGAGRLSAETPMHLLVYRETDATAVVHTHSPQVVAASLVVDEIPAVHYCVLRVGGGSTIRVAPYERFGTDELAYSALKGMEDRTAVVLQNHGALTYGGDLPEAYERAHLLEWMAQVYLAALPHGPMHLLDDEELAAVASETAKRRYAAKVAGR